MLPGLETFLTSEALYIRLIRFLSALISGIVFTRLLLRPLTRLIMERRYTDKKTVHSALNLVEIVALFVVLILSLQTGSFGNLTTVLGTIAAALTVAVGFGMRDQVASVVAGLFIQMSSPFVRGDYIKVQDYEGVVKDIELHATTLDGGSAEKMVVPNSIVVGNVLKNFTRGRKTKTSIEIEVAADRLDEHREALIEAASEEEEVLESGKEVIYLGLREGKMMAELRYWIRDSSDIKKVRSNVLQNYSSKAEERGLLVEPSG
ncbi:MAG: mechanosensitive ion channel family protein [Candidatus Nanohaloarchaea archaeon]